MPTAELDPRPRALEKLVRGRRAKLRLAGACVVVLGLGYLSAPPARSKADAQPAPPRAETVAPALQEEIQRRAPARFYSQLREAGARCLPHTVSFPLPAPRVPTLLELVPPRPPGAPVSGAGLVVSPDGNVLSHAAALAGRLETDVELAGGERARGRVVAREPETDLVLLEVRTAVSLSPAALAASAASAGDVALAAARLGPRDLVAPVFVTSREGPTYALGSPQSVPGLPVFNLDGEALAVVGADGLLAHPAADAVARLLARAVGGPGLGGSIGVALQPLEPGLAERFGPTGALVADVRPDGAAARGGLQPGDVVVKVGDTAVSSPEEALAALASAPTGEPLALGVRRGRRTRTVSATPEATLVVSWAIPPPPPEAPPLASVVPLRRLEELGLDPRARVLSNEPARPAARPGGDTVPRVLRLHDGQRRFFARVDP